MNATLDSTPGVISQIFLCTNTPSSFQRRPLRCQALYLRIPNVLLRCERSKHTPKEDYTFRESFSTVLG